MKKHTKPEGQEYLQTWRDAVGSLDESLTKDDLVGVAKIMRDTLPHLTNLIPHLKNDELQQFVQNIVDEADKLIIRLQAKDANISSIGQFVKTQSGNVSAILAALLETVVGVVGNLFDVLTK